MASHPGIAAAVERTSIVDVGDPLAHQSDQVDRASDGEDLSFRSSIRSRPAEPDEEGPFQAGDRLDHGEGLALGDNPASLSARLAASGFPVIARYETAAGSATSSAPASCVLSYPEE